MTKVTINWEVSQNSGTEVIELEQLDCQTIEEWNELSQEEQRERLQIALDELPERVFIVVDTWESS